MRAMRERFESAGDRRAPRVLTQLLLGLVIVWIAVASLLDKRWDELVIDVVPYVLVYVALLRTPAAMRRVADRMRDHERRAGDEPDDDGPTAIAL